MKFNIEAIGAFKTDRRHKVESPRQGVLSSRKQKGKVILEKGHNYEQALRDLDGFERIWLIYIFHRNESWKPLTRPPSSSHRLKVGTFASRSPYRPGRIGLSCVRLHSVQGLELTVSEFDLLDGTPILDIKPYVAYADAFPGSPDSWVEKRDEIDYVIHCEPLACAQIEHLEKSTELCFRDFIQTQLSSNPTDMKGKRIKVLAGEADHYVIAYRTWRIIYSIQGHSVNVKIIRSAYESSDSIGFHDNRYGDREAHERFWREFQEN